jgi:hypothetical protein
MSSDEKKRLDNLLRCSRRLMKKYGDSQAHRDSLVEILEALVARAEKMVLENL